MTFDIYNILFTVANFLLVAVCFFGFKKVMCLNAIVKEKDREFSQLQEDIRALTSGAAGITDHLARLEQHVRRLSQRQDQLDLRDPVNQSYEHAIKLIRNGAQTDDLITHCGLVRDEAELLVRMYQLDKAS